MKMKLKTRIFIVLALTLLLMLFSSLIIFNTIGRSYIRSEAQRDLEEASQVLETLMTERNYDLSADYDTLYEPLKLIRQLMRNRYLFSDDNIFIMNSSGYVFTMSEDNSKEVQVARAIIGKPALFASDAPFAISADNNSYYAVLKRISNNAEYNWYAVIYADTSLLSTLLKNQSHLLVISLAVSCLLVLLLSYLLISLLTRPITDLKDFARRIGEGDFTPDDTQIDDTDLAELHAEMNNMAARLNASREEQKKFFQNVSHDLRTPLMSIQGYAEGLQYGIFDDVQKPAEVIMEESRRMYGMIDNLVYLSYMESSDIKPNTVMDIRESLSRCIEKMQGMALRDGKEMICDFGEEEMPVLMDEASLERAWQNLLSNALRYCRGKVRISCRREMKKIRICIEDDGDGFAAADLEHIFERFYKGNKGNYGLGLSISKEAIEKHNGSITAANAPQGGAQMLITLPLFGVSARNSLRSH